MKNNRNDNEKFLKTLIERKSRDQLIDNYKAIKKIPAEYPFAAPVIFIIVIMAAVLFPPTAPSQLPLYLITTAVVISFSASLSAADKN